MGHTHPGLSATFADSIPPTGIMKLTVTTLLLVGLLATLSYAAAKKEVVTKTPTSGLPLPENMKEEKSTETKKSEPEGEEKVVGLAVSSIAGKPASPKKVQDKPASTAPKKN